MAEFFDIAIVGGGPAGSTAGTLLAKPGWNVAGSEQHTPEVRWRLWVFDFLVFLQKRFALIAPRMNLQPK